MTFLKIINSIKFKLAIAAFILFAAGLAAGSPFLNVAAATCTPDSVTVPSTVPVGTAVTLNIVSSGCDDGSQMTLFITRSGSYIPVYTSSVTISNNRGTSAYTPDNTGQHGVKVQVTGGPYLATASFNVTSSSPPPTATTTTATTTKTLPGKDLTARDVYCIMVRLMNWTFTIAVILAIVMMIMVGVRYVTASSGGKVDAVSETTRSLKFVFLGIVIIFLAWSLVRGTAVLISVGAPEFPTCPASKLIPGETTKIKDVFPE